MMFIIRPSIFKPMRFSITVLLCLCSIFVIAQTNFNKHQFMNGSTDGNSIIPYYNHFVAGCFNYSEITSGGSTLYLDIGAMIVRLNSQGDTLSSYRIADYDTNYFNQFGLQAAMTFIHGCKGENGNSYWTGYKNTKNNIQYYWQTDLYVVKLDSMGNLLWEKTIDAPFDSTFVGWYIYHDTLSQTIITSGYLTKFTDDKQGFFAELDYSGNLLSLQVPQLNHESFVVSFDRLGSNLVVGGYNRIGFNTRQPFIYSTDKSGNINWTHYFWPDDQLHAVTAVAAIDTTEFMLMWVHAVRRPGSGTWVWNHHLAKMNSSGQLLWDSLMFYSFNTSSRMKHLGNGKLLHSGAWKDTVGGPAMGMLSLYDTSGAVLWERLYDTDPGFKWFRESNPTPDGGFVMVGEVGCCTIVNNSYVDELWVVKTDSLGLITSDNIHPAPPLASSCLGLPYPNPAHSTARVETLIPDGHRAILHLFDLRGKELRQIPLTAGRNELLLDVSDLPAGQYLLALSLDGFKDDTVKLVVGR